MLLKNAVVFSNLLLMLITTVYSSKVPIRVKRYTEDQCGQPLKPVGLVFNGEISKKNQWPYLAALINTQTGKFFCGGSLISRRHILTAAHCIHKKDQTEPKKASEIVAYLGKYNLSIAHERGTVAAYPTEFVIHPDWKPFENAKYDADIAVIKLDDDVALRENIFPVCLWTSDLRPLRDDDDGTVVGWGTSENQAITDHEDVPHEVKVKIVSNERCYAVEFLAKVISYRTYCAGGENAGPCRGDSGGGMFTNRGRTWYLRGIVSSSLIRNDDSCDVNKYAVFTNVARFTNWITSVMGAKIELKCDYEYFFGYECNAKNLTVKHSNMRIVGTMGDHKENKDNNDIETFRINNQQTLHLPTMISDIFPRLLYYSAHASGLKFIEKNNFEGLNSLILIDFGNNNIEVIPKDVFYAIPTLGYLCLNNNKIESLDRDTFIESINLKKVHIFGNRIEFLDAGLFRNNLKMHEMRIEGNRLMFIEPELMTPLKNLKKADFRHNVCLSENYPETVTLSRLKELFIARCKA